MYKNRFVKRNKYNKFRRNNNKYHDRSKHSNQRFITNSKIVQQLINFIYNNIEITRFNYKIIKHESDLSLLDSKKFFISPNYNGFNCLLIFVKLRDKYYSCLINRNTLKFNIDQIDTQKVNITPINIKLNNKIYKGTIIDGILLHHNHRNKKTFIINDIYRFCGKDRKNDIITNKLISINIFLQSYLNNKNSINDINLYVNKLCDESDIKNMINVYIPHSKFKNSITGISFYPSRSSTKYIYLFNNCCIKNKVKKKKIDIRFSGIKVIRTDIIVVFRMKKTDVIDVYNLYLAIKIEKNNKKYIKYKKCGIAYIPTCECSYFCHDLFDSTSNNHVIVECKYSLKHKKWIPFKAVLDRKLCDYYDVIKTKISS